MYKLPLLPQPKENGLLRKGAVLRCLPAHRHLPTTVASRHWGLMQRTGFAATAAAAESSAAASTQRSIQGTGHNPWF